MLSYAPNISWVFPELDFEDRPQAVCKAGFNALEFGFYGGVDLDALRSALDTFGLRVALFNMDMPVWDEAHRGYLADPDLRNQFKHALDAALDVAQYLEAAKLMLPVGARLSEMSARAQADCIVDNLAYAASLAEHAGVLLTIEALYPGDIPNYFLTSSRRAVEIVREVNHPNVRFQFDTYHLQMLEGHLEKSLTESIDAIGHVQFGDAPGRTEPGWGDLDFAHLDAVVERSGYDGYIGLEYAPVSHGSNTFGWVPAKRRVEPPH